MHLHSNNHGTWDCGQCSIINFQRSSPDPNGTFACVCCCCCCCINYEWSFACAFSNYDRAAIAIANATRPCDWGAASTRCGQCPSMCDMQTLLSRIQTETPHIVYKIVRSLQFQSLISWQLATSELACSLFTVHFMHVGFLCSFTIAATQFDALAALGRRFRCHADAVPDVDDNHFALCRQNRRRAIV